MKEKNDFEQEINALEREVGKNAVARTYLVFAKAINWCRIHGHGNLILSAVNHLFGKKIRADTVFTIASDD